MYGMGKCESGYSFSQFNFEERPLADVLSEKLGHKVTIDNDTRAMTYGEYMQGCVKGERYYFRQRQLGSRHRNYYRRQSLHRKIRFLGRVRSRQCIRQ